MAKPPTRPLVFLSHSSKNRRELRALKAFLDHRAAGQIEFFLSSDDESIPPGSIWPTEVKKALDRMKLMVVFLSKDALESSWTYFEAGYGLCKLSVASVYCLEGTKRDAVPPPFDVLQNRNLHSAKDLTLLLKQCNQALGTQLDEAVTKAEFDKIFRTWPSITVKTSPPFHEIVESMVVSCMGKPSAQSIFEKTCRGLGHLCNSTNYENACNSTGISARFQRPGLMTAIPELNPLRMDHHGRLECPPGFGRIDARKPLDQLYEDLSTAHHIPNYAYNWARLSERRVIEINGLISQLNKFIEQRISKKQGDPRLCIFSISSERAAIPLDICKHWVAQAQLSEGLFIQLLLQPTVTHEKRGEFISARLFGTEFECLDGAKMRWKKHVNLSIGDITADRFSSPTSDQSIITGLTSQSLQDFDPQELIASLWQAEIIFKTRATKSRR